MSAKTLHQMVDTSDEVLRGLKVLGAEAEKRDPWLIHILLSKLDSTTKQAWANETAEENFPSMERFFKFLNRRSDSLDATADTRIPATMSNIRVKALHTTYTEVSCVNCFKDHPLSKCEQFLTLDVHKGRGLAAEKKLCFNCLSPTHQAIACRSRYRCNKCHRKHHSSLHSEVVPKVEETKPASSNTVNISDAGSECIQTCHAAASRFQSLLPTAMVKVTDQFGNMQRCRVLLDSGSQASFITEACMQRLKLPRTKANVTVTGLTNGKVCCRGAACVNLKSIYSSDNNIEIEGLIIGQLPTKIPSFSFQTPDSSFLNQLNLADPQYNQVGPIDILIGADRFFHVIADGLVTNPHNSLVAQQTIFGWVVSGVPYEENLEIYHDVQSNQFTLNLHLDIELDRTLKRFFEQEEMPVTPMPSSEEIECESHYKSTHQRTTDGRYVVEIPFRKDAKMLGNSINAAKKRLLALERKLGANPMIKVEYSKSIREYLSLGYLKPICAKEKQFENVDCFYLPHHCVIKESSDTTKLRVVFDGSAKSSSGVSLNETMLVGPTIQPTLWSILMRFRSYKVALVGDIEKMYSQVLVTEKDTHFQRILWRDEESDEIEHYKLNRVTFGLASSSFLAIRTLQQIGYDNEREYPDIVSHIISDFYVDDFISGADTVEEALELKEKICHVLRSGGFNLRKFQSNKAEVMECGDANKISTFQNSAGSSMESNE